MNASSLRKTVEKVVRDTPVYDIHTHLYAPAFDCLLLFGIDEMLTYHYLVAEVFRADAVSYGRFWSLSKSEQADLIWNALFIENSPLSEACRGVLTTLNALGLEVRQRDLTALRKYFSEQNPDEFVSRCMEIGKVRRICMTNSPFDELESPVWENGFSGDERFAAALRIDPLLMQWETTGAWLQKRGYAVEADLSGHTFAEVQRFLREWAARMNALYVMVSLPPAFAFPEQSPRARLIEEAILPFCRDSSLPFALMMGVTREVNPALKLAGDGVGRADLDALKNLCASFPDNKFLATVLSRENQHELCVLARKFANLHPFGCWWFTNVPSIIDEMTRMRLELLGPTFTPQHSDARVLDQLIYKWNHSRAAISKPLCDQYEALNSTGWNVMEAEIRRDVEQLFGGAFEAFCAR